jgi:ABC-type spermidine/putrescine transport system permease subunit I
MRRATRAWSRLRADGRALAAEPAVAAAVLVLFALLGLFVLYPLGRVLGVGLAPEGTLSLRLFREALGSWFVRRALANSLLMGGLTPSWASPWATSSPTR